MNDRMKTFLTRAAAPIGTTANMFNEFRAAQKAGWIKSLGCPQNSTTTRYGLTEQGQTALAAA